jgi:uncharacterized protein YndB with AHSA1/START domain
MNDSETNQVADRTVGEVTHIRTYAAPRELVFECMTTPAHLAHFWGPVGVSTPVDNITLDPRQGGIFETVMVNDDSGEEYPMRAVFVEFVAPERLAWSEPDVEGGMTTSLTFTDLGDGRTEVVVHQTNVPEMYRSPEAQAGMTSSFEKFAAYVGTLLDQR